MFSNSHLLTGFLLTRNVTDQGDRVLAAVMAAQFPPNNMLGPLLLKPAVVDKMEELEATKADLTAARNRVAALEAKQAALTKVATDLRIQAVADIDGLDLTDAATANKLKEALKGAMFPRPNVPAGP